MLNKVVKAEAGGLVPAGTSTHLESVLISLHDMMNDLAYPLETEYAYFSQAMGFVNPKAVNEIQVPQNPASILNGEKVLDIEEFKKLVLGRSIELRQMNNIIDAVKIGVKIDGFAWFDPVADTNHALGLALGPTIKIDKTQVEIEAIAKNQVASSVLATLSSTITLYNHSTDSVDDSNFGIKFEQGRIDKINAALDSGQIVSADEITSVTLDKLKWQITLLDSTLNNRSSLATLRRLLLQDNYSNLDNAVSPSKKK